MSYQQNWGFDDSDYDCYGQGIEEPEINNKYNYKLILNENVIRDITNHELNCWKLMITSDYDEQTSNMVLEYL
jgi:hypothetical protein